LALLLTLLFFFTNPSPTETYTLSLHDALPIYVRETGDLLRPAILKNLKIFSSEISDLPSTLVDYGGVNLNQVRSDANDEPGSNRSEEHTSELQSPYDLVCRLLLEKKKKNKKNK